MQRVVLLAVAGALALVIVHPDRALAQGFGLYEHSACTMGRGGASVAAPCEDGSAVFFNPAGLNVDPKLRISFGGTAIQPAGTFTNDRTGTETSLVERTYPAPHVYVSKGFGGRYAVGFGLWAPYGLTTEWPTTFEGRFVGYKASVQTIYLQPTFAARLTDQVTAGFGLVISRMSVELRQRVDLSVQQVPGTPAGFTWSRLGVATGTDFADINLEGHAYGWGVHAGVQAKINERFSFGARFLSNQTIDVDDGRLTTAQIATGFRLPVALGPLPAGTPVDPLLETQFRDGAALENGQTGTTSLPMPAQFVAGVAVRATPKVLLLADYRWNNWSQFDRLVIVRENSQSQPTVNIEDYQNTSAIHIGTDIDLNPRFVVRGGYFWNSAAAPDYTVTPLLPEGARHNIAAGLGVKLSNDIRLDFAYHRLQQGERAGRSGDLPAAPPYESANNGMYTFHANLFALTLGLAF